MKRSKLQPSQTQPVDSMAQWPRPQAGFQPKPDSQQFWAAARVAMAPTMTATENFILA